MKTLWKLLGLLSILILCIKCENKKINQNKKGIPRSKHYVRYCIDNRLFYEFHNPGTEQISTVQVIGEDGKPVKCEEREQ